MEEVSSSTDISSSLSEFIRKERILKVICLYLKQLHKLTELRIFYLYKQKYLYLFLIFYFYFTKKTY